MNASFAMCGKHFGADDQGMETVKHKKINQTSSNSQIFSYKAHCQLICFHNLFDLAPRIADAFEMTQACQHQV